MLQALVRNFLRGLLILVPTVVTVYAAYLVFVTVDGWINVDALLDRRIPGAGFAITIAAITLTGFLAANIWTRWLFKLPDRLFGKLPLVKLLYSSMKDLVGAFVGEQRRFDRPVLIRPIDGEDWLLLGFETRDTMDVVGLGEHAAVYVPQAYNFGGMVVVVPRSRVQALEMDGVSAMTFALSGGVSGLQKNAS